MTFDNTIFTRLAAWWSMVHEPEQTFFLGVGERLGETTYHYSDNGLFDGVITNVHDLTRHPLQGVCCKYTLVVLDQEAAMHKQVWDQAQAITTSKSSGIITIGVPSEKQSL